MIEFWPSLRTFAVTLQLELAGLLWGLNFNPHAHPIPIEKPVGIPTESPYPHNPEILHTRTLHPVYFCLMHTSFYFFVMYAICM